MFYDERRSKRADCMDNKEKFEGTIFDDVYRSMAQKMTFLMIPLINEVFGQTYPEDEKIETLRNEHYEPTGKIITDSIYRIGDCLYHIECQSTKDGNMALRMLEYDFAIALDRAEMDEEGNETITFPSSCVVYVRNHRDIPDEHTVTVRLPGGETFKYKAKTIQVRKYSPNEIFSKHLYVFLPYFILRYEHFIKSKSTNQKKTEELMAELKKIYTHLQSDDIFKERDVYVDIIELIQKILDYIVPEDHPGRERMAEYMGGQVLELYSERMARKMARMENEKKAAEQRNIMAAKNFKAVGMKIDQIASAFGVSEQIVTEWLNSDLS